MTHLSNGRGDEHNKNGYPHGIPSFIFFAAWLKLMPQEQRAERSLAQPPRAQTKLAP